MKVRRGALVFDAPVVIQSYTSVDALDEHAEGLWAFLVRMGQETAQGAVGFVIDRTYLEISFPLDREE